MEDKFMDVVAPALHTLLRSGWEIERLDRNPLDDGYSLKATRNKWAIYFDTIPGLVDEGTWELPSEGKYIRFKHLSGLIDIACETAEQLDAMWRERKSEQRQGTVDLPATCDDVTKGNDDEPSVTNDVIGAFDDLEERLAFAAPEMVKFHLDIFRQEILDIVSSEN